MEFLLNHLDLLLFLSLLTLGFFAGRFLEQRHYRSIRKREKALAKVLTFATRFPPNLAERQDCRLVTGCVVISSDYFKQFVATLRNLVGGRFRGYETLMDRARREAILRMKEDAKRNGYSLIVNVRLENTSISGGRQGAMPAFELLAYGTAIKPPRTGSA
jgi:uncharacterized protein YbjQ (UPF0145 family)